MSLLSQNNNKGKKGGKNAKGALPGAKPVLKPGKSSNVTKKPVKTGGTRGS